jgi:hypothetical protein
MPSSSGVTSAAGTGGAIDCSCSVTGDYDAGGRERALQVCACRGGDQVRCIRMRPQVCGEVHITHHLQRIEYGRDSINGANERSIPTRAPFSACLTAVLISDTDVCALERLYAPVVVGLTLSSAGVWEEANGSSALPVHTVCAFSMEACSLGADTDHG